MTHVFCALPAVAFLFAKLGWLARGLLSLPIVAGAVIGVYNTRMDFECSYAGDVNPMLVSFLETHHTQPDLATPIFSYDLTLNGGTAEVQLMVGIGVALAMLVTGIVVARRGRQRSGRPAP